MVVCPKSKSEVGMENVNAFPWGRRYMLVVFMRHLSQVVFVCLLIEELIRDEGSRISSANGQQLIETWITLSRSVRSKVDANIKPICNLCVSNTYTRSYSSYHYILMMEDELNIQNYLSKCY